MKSLLFCLLACCVLENVFASKLEDQLNEVYDNGVKKVNAEIANPILALLQIEVGDADAPVEAQACYEKAECSMKKNVASVTNKLDRCRVAGRGIRNVEIAKKCSNTVISAFQKDANKIGSTAETCIGGTPKE